MESTSTPLRKALNRVKHVLHTSRTDSSSSSSATKPTSSGQDSIHDAPLLDDTNRSEFNRPDSPPDDDEEEEESRHLERQLLLLKAEHENLGTQASTLSAELQQARQDAELLTTQLASAIPSAALSAIAHTPAASPSPGRVSPSPAPLPAASPLSATRSGGGDQDIVAKLQARVHVLEQQLVVLEAARAADALSTAAEANHLAKRLKAAEEASKRSEVDIAAQGASAEAAQNAAVYAEKNAAALKTALDKAEADMLAMQNKHAEELATAHLAASAARAQLAAVQESLSAAEQQNAALKDALRAFDSADPPGVDAISVSFGSLGEVSDSPLQRRKMTMEGGITASSEVLGPVSGSGEISTKDSRTEHRTDDRIRAVPFQQPAMYTMQVPFHGGAFSTAPAPPLPSLQRKVVNIENPDTASVLRVPRGHRTRTQRRPASVMHIKNVPKAAFLAFLGASVATMLAAMGCHKSHGRGQVRKSTAPKKVIAT